MLMLLEGEKHLQEGEHCIEVKYDCPSLRPGFRNMPSPRPSLSGIGHTFTGSLTSDGEAGVRVAGFLPHAHPLRRNVTDYSTGYFNTLNHTANVAQPIPSHPPPSYYDIQDRTTLPPPRFPVLPREEEGRERLPEYYCSVHRESVFHLKMELSSPFDRATDRSWRKEYVVLHGTLLKMHKPKRIPFFSTPEMRSGQGEDGSTRPAGWIPGELLRRYTLQGAEVGIAGDYKKRHYVIRIRAETEQFLLSSKRVEEFMSWLEALSAAVDLSPSLEERSLPRYQTIPRRRRRRDGAQVIREQQRIIRSQFPHLIGDIPEEEDEEFVRRGVSRGNSRRSDIEAEIESHTRRQRAATTAATATGDGNTDPSTATQLTRVVSLQESITEQDLLEAAAELEPSRQTMTVSSSSSHGPSSSSSSVLSSARTVNQAQQSPEQKWRPSTTISPEANLRYARRCMAVLCGDAPRQSDFIVKDGRRYRLVWESKVMIPEATGAPTIDSISGAMQVANGRKGKPIMLPQYDEIFSGPVDRRTYDVDGNGSASNGGVVGVWITVNDAPGLERSNMVGVAL